MRQEFYERGSGMTRKKYMKIHISSKDSKADWDTYHSIHKKLKNFDEQLKYSEEDCRQRLRPNGLPDTAIVNLGEKIEMIDKYVIDRKGYDEDTDAGYAARILRHLHWILNRPTQDGLWDLVYHGYFAGFLTAEASLKFGKWEKLALEREKDLKQLASARSCATDSTREKYSPLWAEFNSEAEKIRDKNPRLKKHAVAMQIQARRESEGLENRTFETITKHIEHLWPKKI